MQTEPKKPKRNPKYEYWRWQIFAISSLTYAGLYMTRRAFSVAKIGMSECTDVSLTKAQISQIDMAYLIVYAVGQFVWGICGDRFGPRKVLILGMLTSSLLAFTFGISSSFFIFAIVIALQGLCQATGWAPLVKNLSAFFVERERGIVVGFWCAAFSLLGFLLVTFSGYLGDWFGWRYAFIGSAITLPLICVLFFFLQRNKPEDIQLPPIEQYKGTQKQTEAQTTESVPEPAPQEQVKSIKIIYEAIANWRVWYLSVLYFLLKPVRYAIWFWGPIYVNDKLGAKMGAAAMISGFFMLIAPVGAITSGFLSDKLFKSKRMPVCAIFLLLLSVILFFLDDLPATKLSLSIGFLLIGFLSYGPDVLISGTATMDISTKKSRATTAGIINGFGSTGAILGGTIPGFFYLRWGWDGIFALFAAGSLLASIMIFPRWNLHSNTASDK